MKFTVDLELTNEQFEMLRLMQYTMFPFNEQDGTCVDLMGKGLVIYDYTYKRWELLPIGRSLVLNNM